MTFTAQALAVPVERADPTYSWRFDAGAGETVTASTGPDNGSLGTGNRWETGGNTPFAYSGNAALVFDGTTNSQVPFAGMVNQLDGLSVLTISSWGNADAINNRGILLAHSTTGDSNLQFRFDEARASGGDTDVIKLGTTSKGTSRSYESASGAAVTGNWRHDAYT